MQNTKEMKLLVSFASLFVCFSTILITPCVSIQIHDQSSSHEIHNHNQFSLPNLLPRKLRVVHHVDEEVTFKGHRVQVFSTSNAKQKADFSGKPYDKEENGGTRQEGVEGTDTTQYFTMDYSHATRRRPIHNKSLPFGP